MNRLAALAPDWGEISALLDEALSLPAGERAAWIEALAGEQARLRDTLRQLLSTHADRESRDFLGTLPKVGAEPSLTTPGTALAAGTTIGPYRLLRELGHGGMGAVWLAERADGAFERKVALKLPLVHRLRHDLAARFLRERDILARLEHPHIARLYDAGIDNEGLPYLAMEHVQGQPLDVFCDTTRLNLRARLALFDQVLDAVQYAHAHLVIHRDLKPSNILVTAEGQVRLLDFGIAKLLDDEQRAEETALTQLSGRALTPEYASPEQIEGRTLTVASDLYSLGVVLFELLAGRRPYRLSIQSRAQLEQAIVNVEVEAPSRAITAAAAAARSCDLPRLRKQLSGDIDNIVLKVLAKDPAQRYASVAVLADDLRRHLDGEPVHARAATWRYRIGKFVRRHRLVAGAASVVTLALVTALVVSLWQVRTTRYEAQRAEATKAFVLSLLESADVVAGANRSTTAVDLLRQARERLATSPGLDDAMQVELLTTVGSGLLSLGELQQAATVLAQAQALATARLDPAHPAAAAAMLAQGFALQATSGCKVAAPNFEQAASAMRSAGNMRGLSGALRGVACIHAMQGNGDAAIAAIREAVTAAEQQPEPIDRRTLLLALIENAGLLDGWIRAGALQPARRAMEVAQALYGDRPAKLALDARSVHAIALAGEGQIEHGIRELNAVLGHMLELVGPDHQEVAGLRRVLGLLHRRLGDPLGGLPHLQESLRAGLAQSGGKATYEVGSAQYQIAQALSIARRDAQALVYWQQAARSFTEAVGADAVPTRNMLSGVAVTLTRLGRLEEAQEAFPRMTAANAAGTQDASLLNVRLAELRSAQGRHDEALGLMQGNVPAYDTAPVAIRDREHALIKADAAQLLLAAGRHVQALEQFQAADGLLHRTQPRGSPERAEIAHGRSRAHLGLKQLAPAAAAAAVAVDFWQRYDPGGRAHGLALLQQSRCWAAARDWAAAAAAWKQAEPILRRGGLAADAVALSNVQRELAER